MYISANKHSIQTLKFHKNFWESCSPAASLDEPPLIQAKQPSITDFLGKEVIWMKVFTKLYVCFCTSAKFSCLRHLEWFSCYHYFTAFTVFSPCSLQKLWMEVSQYIHFDQQHIK
jgi:hypothetical protein